MSGVGTGEVIAERPAPGRPPASGHAVNAAKRLEEAAGAGEILIDDATLRVVRDFVDVELGRPPAAGVVALRPEGARPRKLDSPLVGRAQQIEGLSSAVAAALADRSCHLVTVLGAAGVGKSRLVEDFVDGLGGRACVLRGRCLPYGEGITYWPLADVVRDLIGDGDGREASSARSHRRAARGRAEGRADRARSWRTPSASAAPAGATSEEIFWAVRRLFEALARTARSCVVLDDLQWAEPTFLDLVEHVADLARDAPIVLLCMARPELLEAAPAGAAAS